MRTASLLTRITKVSTILLSLQLTAAKALFLLDLEPELHHHLYGQFNLTVLWKYFFKHIMLFKVELLLFNKKKMSK